MIPTAPVKVADAVRSTGIARIACPSQTLCVAAESVLGPADGSIRGTITRSVDGGKTWATAYQDPSDSRMEEITCVSGTLCLAGGLGCPTPACSKGAANPLLVVSHDGGTTWTPSTLPETRPGTGVVYLSCVDDSRCLALTNESQAGNAYRLFATTDAGATWQPATIPNNLAFRFAKVTCFGYGRCLLATTNWGPTGSGVTPKLFSTDDLGATWKPVALPDSINSLAEVTCLNRQRCFAVGTASNRQALTSLTSGDGMQTWSTTNDAIPLAEDTGAYVPMGIFCTVTGKCTVAVTDHQGRSHILSSTDGSNWTTTFSLPPGSTISGLGCSPEGRCHAVGGSHSPDPTQRNTEPVLAEGT